MHKSGVIVAKVGLDPADLLGGDDVISEVFLPFLVIVVSTLSTIVGIPMDVDVVDIGDDCLELW